MSEDQPTAQRYELRPHKHNADFPHDGGYALYDTVENKQCGWFKDRDRCKLRVDESNAAERRTAVDHAQQQSDEAIASDHAAKHL